MTEWTLEKVREHYKDILKEMIALKTNMVIDTKGNVWAFGRWYGGHPHFRRNFGHWSEDVLDLSDEWRWYNNLPLKPFIDERKPTEEDKKWAEFYRTPIGDNKE